MKKSVSRITAFILSASMTFLNIPVGYAEEEPQLHITNIISGETSKYGMTDVKEIDENGTEVYHNLIPHREDRAVLLPEAYDLRDYGYSTSVKNQGSTGTCWAHSALASAESNMIINGLADKSVDLSESHLVWFGNCRYSTNPDDVLYHEGHNEGTDGYDNGGNYVIAVATLARWNGIQFEKNFSDVRKRPSIDESYRYTSYGYLQNSDSIDKNDREAIKLHIMNSGALLASFASLEEYFSKNNISYYCPEEHNTNHGITIIGWDDNYSKKNFGDYIPETDGAWICKNSWGESWGDNGYFYLSYCDMTYSKITSFEISPTDKYDKIYQYDALADSCIHFNDMGIAAANIYTSDKYEALNAVSFYTREASVPYKIYIYSGITDGKPTSGKLIYTEDGVQQYAGYHVVDLTKSVYISPDTNFSVVVALKQANAYFTIDSGTSENSSSYYSYYNVRTNKIGNWADLSVRYGADACIKAFTKSDEELIPACVKTGKHDFTEYTNSEDGTHSRTCTVCNYTESAEHDLSNWTTNKDGTHSRTCADCGYTESDVHFFGLWASTDNKHFCSCEICGYTESAEHDFSKWTITRAKHSHSCTVCGYTESAEHNFGKWTIDKDVSHSRTCTECGYVELAEHSFGKWTTTKDGKHSHTCADCGYVESTEHSFGKWTTTKDGTHSRTCTYCGYVESAEHNIIRELCAGGIVKYSCKDCDYTNQEKISYIKGDITGDNRVDVFDMIMFRKLYTDKLKKDTDIYAVDMNEDLEFTIADLVALNNYLLNK